MSVQYRVSPGKGAAAKRNEAVEGPDDATLVVSIEAAGAGLDPAVAYMQGSLKVVGPSAELFAVLRSGEAAAAIRRLAGLG